MNWTKLEEEDLIRPCFLLCWQDFGQDNVLGWEKHVRMCELERCVDGMSTRPRSNWKALPISGLKVSLRSLLKPPPWEPINPSATAVSIRCTHSLAFSRTCRLTHNTACVRFFTLVSAFHQTLSSCVLTTVNENLWTHGHHNVISFKHHAILLMAAFSKDAHSGGCARAKQAKRTTHERFVVTYSWN